MRGEATLIEHRWADPTAMRSDLQLDELVAEQGPVSEAAVVEVRRQWPED
jgi:hypothetical protein